MNGRQSIRFCTSVDCVRLAVATVGQGAPIVRAATWLTHVEKDADNLCNRHWGAELSREHLYVRYDSRGCGLSDRDVERFSVEAWIEDLEAVADALELAGHLDRDHFTGTATDDEKVDLVDAQSLVVDLLRFGAEVDRRLGWSGRDEIHGTCVNW